MKDKNIGITSKKTNIYDTKPYGFVMVNLSINDMIIKVIGGVL